MTNASDCALRLACPPLTHAPLPHPPLGDPAETDYTAVGCAVTTISSNLTEMSRGVKLLAALLEDEGGSGRPLLQAAKGLAGAVSELLRSAQPASAEVRGHGLAPGQRAQRRRGQSRLWGRVGGPMGL